MSHCRMENTVNDLEDCWENWELSDKASNYEKKSKERIIELAREILESEGYKVTK